MADRRLQVFHAVAKNLSFTKAAETLFMTQPAVTFQIKQLEEQFNTRLFERNHAHIALTPAGELMLEYADRILALSDEMETRLSEMTGEMRGSLLVGASTSIADSLLPIVLSEFNALYPRVKLVLVVANSEGIENRVVDHSVDVGLIGALCKSPNLVAEACGEDEQVVICSPEYPLAGMAEVTPRMLQEYEFISRELGSGTRELAEAYFDSHGVPPGGLKTLMELGSPEALKGMVETGLGFAIAARSVVRKELELGILAAVPLNPRLNCRFHLIYPKDRFQSRLVRTFINFAKQKLKELAL